MLEARKRHKRGLSNSFHNLNNDKLRYTFNNSAYAEGYTGSPMANLLQGVNTSSNRIGSHSNSLVDGNEGNDLEPSTVNDKLPTKFIIDYPNFLKPAKYFPYRRLQEHHIADVLQEARKRHEENLSKIKKDDDKHNDQFFKSLEENKKRIQDLEYNRKKVYEEHKKCLQDQIRQKRVMDKYDYDEGKRYVKTHFGPEESEERTKLSSDKVLQEREYLRSELMSQIEEKRSNIVNRIIKEKVEDQKALDIIAKIK